MFNRDVSLSLRMPFFETRVSMRLLPLAIPLSLLWMGSPDVPACAETPAPNVHWGALAYPDQAPALEFGLTLFRFTEFNGAGDRYNAIDETMGLNFITLSWTEHLKFLRRPWSTNLTVGVGPTRDDPTQFLQNDFIHDAVFGIPKVPTAGKRDETDFMIQGSVNHWFDLGPFSKFAFAGLGFASGSLYHEVYTQLGVRRWAPMKSIQKIANLQPATWIDNLNRLSLSVMGRYGRPYSGAAFREVAPQTYVLQGSVAYGWYSPDHHPWVEMEFGVTLNSGLFVDLAGDSLEELFWTLALRAHPFTLEAWNDQLKSKDFGPTFGARLMMEIYFLVPDAWRWR